MAIRLDPELVRAIRSDPELLGILERQGIKIEEGPPGDELTEEEIAELEEAMRAEEGGAYTGEADVATAEEPVEEEEIEIEEGQAATPVSQQVMALLEQLLKVIPADQLIAYLLSAASRTYK